MWGAGPCWESGATRLDQGSRLHQAFVGIQAGEEADVSVLVGLQGHHRLFQLVRVGTTRLLEVGCTHNTTFRDGMGWGVCRREGADQVIVAMQG